MLNDLFVFDLQNHSWIMLSASGEAPQPRASHTATKINEQCFCIIGGGNLNVGFNDVHLFNIETLCWTKIKTSGEEPESRAGHSATKIDQKIIIFGGGDFEGEIFSDLYTLDLSYMASTQKMLQ